jgi:hypothetical protein
MKKLLVTVLFSFYMLACICQPDTVLRIRTDRDNINIKERYYVLKSDKQIRYGSFLRFGVSFSQYYLLEEGRYVNDQKSGIWRLYYDGPPYNQISSRGTFKDEMKDGYWEFFYYNRYFKLSGTDSNVPDPQNHNSTAVYYIKEGNKKSSGNFIGGRKTGIWNYYDITGNVILSLDHSKDSVAAIDYPFLPERDSLGIIRPFFEGGNNYLYILSQIYPSAGIDKTGTITYKLSVDKNTIDNKLTLLENNTSKATEAAVRKKIMIITEGWIPQINNLRVETAEITLLVTVTGKNYTHVVNPDLSSSGSFSISTDVFRFNIEIIH